ncbi:MAG: hypothetical protein KDA66_08885 [Planctomycetaceae bacterium]|nr:hypothetical protein [Planctomycetaceae bacterium]
MLSRKEGKRLPMGVRVLSTALLIACISVVLGVFTGQSPDIIVYRAGVSGVVVAILAAGLELLLKQQFTSPDDDDLDIPMR